MKRIIASVVAMLATVSMMACGSQVEVDKNEGEITTTTSATTTTVTTTVTTTNITTSEVTTENVTEESVSEAVNETGLSSAKTDSVEGSETILSEIITEKCEETTNSEPKNSEEYIVYKPSTKFLHRNSCRWNNGDAYRVDCTTELVARLCDECNPDVKDFIEYVEPEPIVEYMSDSDKYYIAVMLTHECNSRAGASHNAHSVAAMVNRVNRGDSSSIYNAIANSCAPWWEYGHGSWCMDNGCMNGVDSGFAYDAINYYLNNADSYRWVTGWYAYGDGVYNVYY